MSPVTVDVGPLAPEDVIAVARGGAPVVLGEAALAAIDRAREVVDELAAAPTPAYGISTGFGALATRHIPTEMRAQLQRSLVRSHAAGSGPEVEREVVRALVLLRLSTLATGRTGVRRETAELMAGLLNAGLTPVVHEYGSLGCSGDLAPLAHCALALIGEGSVRDAAGDLVPAADALAAAGLVPVELAAKEGLALINGTDGMLGMLVMALTDLDVLMRTADITAAMSVEAQLATDRVFAAELQALRPHPGQAASAANLVAILERRTDRFLAKARNHGLPPFLADDPGVDSGHMSAQYTQAAIVSELKRLAAPASVDSIPSSAMQEDHVSMGWSAARKLRRSVDGLARVLAVEYLTAARGIELRGEGAAPVVGRVIEVLRTRVPAPGPDRYLAPEIAGAVELVQSGALLAA